MYIKYTILGHPLFRDGWPGFTGASGMELESGSYKNAMVMKDKGTDRSWVRISPWVIVGAFIVLVPIFAFMTVKTIRTQQENMVMLLREKGDALIRSLEAGTRTGMLGSHWSWVQIQRLIMETAEQPDILYIFITDGSGRMIAHNQPVHIGRAHETDLDYAAIDDRTRSRRIVRSDGKPVFEVYRKFTPSRIPLMPQGRYRMRDNPLFSRSLPAGPDLNVFIGLDMDPIVKTTRENTIQSVLVAVILLLIGFSGIVTIIIGYNYRLARMSLSRIKAFSDTIVDNMPVGLVFIGEKGDVITMNSASERMLKTSLRHALGKNASDALPFDVGELLKGAHASGSVLVREIDVPVRGRDMLFEASAGVISDHGTGFLGYIVLLRDITEIRHLKNEVLRKERLASLGSLAAGVAHEIRNPLSSIKGFATYFKERYRDVPEDRKTADIMIREVERLNRVIGQLLEFARPLNIERKPADIRDVVRHSLELVSAQAASRNVLITTDDTTDEPPHAVIDQDRISQVLLNVYLNSLDAMESGGTLNVRLENDEINSNIVVHVSDTGRGIPSQDIGRVFDPYFTTKQSGTGLGLAVVHKIIEAHSGRVKITSSENQGTTVSLIIPAKDE